MLRLGKRLERGPLPDPHAPPALRLRAPRAHGIEGRKLGVVSVEDLLLFKLLAHRKKDQADIEELLLACGALDLGYARKWAEQLGTSEPLETVLRESDRS